MRLIRAGALLGIAFTMVAAGSVASRVYSEPESAPVVSAPPSAADGAHLVTDPALITDDSGEKDDVGGAGPQHAAPAGRPRVVKSAHWRSGGSPRSPKPQRAAVPATVFVAAKHVPVYPPDGRHGRRIVYSKALMHVWIVDENEVVLRDYPVIGRWDRPAQGVYRVYSKSQDTMNTHSKVIFSYMVRFAWGKEDRKTSIGFHSIPVHYADVPRWNVKKGDPVSTPAELGLPIAEGGCVRALADNAAFLFRWAKVGDRVVVLPTAT